MTRLPDVSTKGSGMVRIGGGAMLAVAASAAAIVQSSANAASWIAETVVTASRIGADDSQVVVLDGGSNLG